MRWYLTTRSRLGLALGCSSLVSVALFGVGAVRDHSVRFDYLVYNLFLAWIPLGLTLWLVHMLRTRLWSSWPSFLLTLFWLGFLPNTFYMISDYIHIQDITNGDLLYDIIMFSSFILNAFILGLVSLFLIHSELRKRVSLHVSWWMMSAAIFLVSFAIYIGRDLRWNTWDVFLNPASILFDVSDRLLNPRGHPEMFSTTLGFSMLISSTYVVIWYLARILRQQKSPE